MSETVFLEVHERLDFAERLLAQDRDRAVLKSENR